ncbi:MAG: hypothetical protein HY075_07270 [Deltaproteobacteria bacterium]|nr:hypothetical protein [Deltaproteobacteria bacterium]
MLRKIASGSAAALLPLALASCAGKGVVSGLALNLPRPYEITERATSRDGDSTVESAEARAGDGRVVRVQKLGGVSPELADRLVRDRLFQIESIYEPHRDPYFASLTKNTSCPARFQPVRRREGAVETLALFANDRLTYGACTSDLAAYRVLVSFVDCSRSRNVFVVEYFVPARLFGAEDEAFTRSLQCL